MQKYVAGFLFDESSQNVVLIKKARPAWQAGRYNAVGGKVEDGETSCDAMIREFFEETGYNFALWERFAILSGFDFKCDFYRGWGEIDKCSTQESEEPIVKLTVAEAKLLSREEAISNVPWLLGLALNTGAGIQFPVKIKYI